MKLPVMIGLILLSVGLSTAPVFRTACADDCLHNENKPIEFCVDEDVTNPK